MMLEQLLDMGEEFCGGIAALPVEDPTVHLDNVRNLELLACPCDIKLVPLARSTLSPRHCERRSARLPPDTIDFSLDEKTIRVNVHVSLERGNLMQSELVGAPDVHGARLHLHHNVEDCC